MARFQTRARAVDMLGRQQIANPAAAISELFKNAHDAYSTNAEIDYFRGDRLFILRDNGVGMTREDFENKWLVLGTESKFDRREGTQPGGFRPPELTPRPIMGEKGIGRLAIALLGPIVLVLSRARREDGLRDGVACLIHWGLFELPGVNIEEIELPVQTFPGGTVPDGQFVAGMVSELLVTVDRLMKKHGSEPLNDIRALVASFSLDPCAYEKWLKGLNMSAEHSGTHFYIKPANEVIQLDIDRELETKRAERSFTQSLIGFTDATFSEDVPPMQTSFRYWRTDDGPLDLIEEGEFFTKEDLEAADHRISGVVDLFGNFSGKVRTYDVTHDYVAPWPGANGNETICGPFEIEFGYVMGKLSATHMAPEEWARLYEKSMIAGGVYVYRDHIRILPYGNAGVDWLSIETRRNKGAAFYFFSNRRIFGAVSLTRRNNRNLEEKAGREGFQHNKAYKQFTNILENLLQVLARDFFRSEGDYSEHFLEKSTELKRLDSAREAQKKKASTKKKELESALETFEKAITDKKPLLQISALKERVDNMMNSAVGLQNREAAAALIVEAEAHARFELARIKENFRITKPRGFSLSKSLQLRWEDYQTAYANLDKEVFSRYNLELSAAIGSLADEARGYIDQRKRLQQLLGSAANEQRRQLRGEATGVSEQSESNNLRAKGVVRRALEDLSGTITRIETELSQENLTGKSVTEIEVIRERIESGIVGVGEKHRESLSRIREMLILTSEGIDLDAPAVTEEMEVMEADLRILREQADDSAESLQLGQAVAIIHHEFESSIAGVRRSLRDLHRWAEVNRGLGNVYRALRASFDHLDGHLTLFTPLQRRLARQKSDFTGGDIYEYVRRLFKERMERHKVNLLATDSFARTKLVGYEATILASFVNIVDNAIYWLSRSTEPREIQLDAKNDCFLIINNGPSIPDKDKDAIFQRGFSRRPGGRGLGLFISRVALKKEGYVLSVEPSKKGCAFRISFPN